MSLETFSNAQVDALLELLALGMYVDGHLAGGEDEKVKQLARAAGVPPGYDLDQALDSAITAVSRSPINDATIPDHSSRIFAGLGNRAARQIAFAALEEVHLGDGGEAESEKKFAAAVKARFEL
jgi:hypothetical protein